MRILRQENELINSAGYSSLIAHGQGLLSTWELPERYHLPLAPDFVHRIELHTGEYSKHHLKSNYCFELPYEGSLKITQQQTVSIVTPGMVGIIHCGEDSLITVGQEGICRKFSFGLVGTALHVLIAAAGLKNKLAFQVPDLKMTLNKLGRLEKGLREQMPGSYSSLCGIAMELLTDFSFAASSWRDERINTALNIFSANVSKRISVEETADKLGMSRMTLERLFRSCLGKTPKEYLTELRIQIASELLISSPLSVNEISEKVGCRDSMSFSRQFKKYTGHSPREFRHKFSL